MRLVTCGPLPSSINESDGNASPRSVAGFGATASRLIREVAVPEPIEADVDITASCAVAMKGTVSAYRTPAATPIRRLPRRGQRPTHTFATRVIRCPGFGHRIGYR